MNTKAQTASKKTVCEAPIVLTPDQIAMVAAAGAGALAETINKPTTVSGGISVGPVIKF